MRLREMGEGKHEETVTKDNKSDRRLHWFRHATRETEREGGRRSWRGSDKR